MSDMQISEEAAMRAIHEHSIVSAVPYPACVEFVLGDHRHLRMYDGDREYSREWEIIDG
jgi:hypothetical protein